MADRSAISLLGILQRHGVSVGMLERWVHALERRETGMIAFHQKDGKVKLYKLEMSGTAQDDEKEGVPQFQV